MPKKLTDWDRKCQTAHGVTVKLDMKKTGRYKRRILRVLKARPRAIYDLSRLLEEFQIRENNPRGGGIELFNAITELKESGEIIEYPHPRYQGIKAYRLNKEKD